MIFMNDIYKEVRFDLYYYHLKTHSPIDLGISRALKEKKQFNETKWIQSRK